MSNIVLRRKYFANVSGGKDSLYMLYKNPSDYEWFMNECEKIEKSTNLNGYFGNDKKNPQTVAKVDKQVRNKWLPRLLKEMEEMGDV